MTLHHGDRVHSAAVADSVFIESGRCIFCFEKLGQILIRGGEHTRWYRATFDACAQGYVVHECRGAEAA